MSLSVQNAKRKCMKSKGRKTGRWEQKAKTSSSILKSKGKKEERGKGGREGRERLEQWDGTSL